MASEQRPFGRSEPPLWTDALMGGKGERIKDHTDFKWFQKLVGKRGVRLEVAGEGAGAGTIMHQLVDKATLTGIYASKGWDTAGTAQQSRSEQKCDMVGHQEGAKGVMLLVRAADVSVVCSRKGGGLGDEEIRLTCGQPFETAYPATFGVSDAESPPVSTTPRLIWATCTWIAVTVTFEDSFFGMDSMNCTVLPTTREVRVDAFCQHTLCEFWQVGVPPLPRACCVRTLTCAFSYKQVVHYQTSSSLKLVEPTAWNKKLKSHFHNLQDATKHDEFAVFVAKRRQKQHLEPFMFRTFLEQSRPVDDCLPPLVDQLFFNDASELAPMLFGASDLPGFDLLPSWLSVTSVRTVLNDFSWQGVTPEDEDTDAPHYTPCHRFLDLAASHGLEAAQVTLDLEEESLYWFEKSGGAERESKGNPIVDLSANAEAVNDAIRGGDKVERGGSTKKRKKERLDLSVKSDARRQFIGRAGREPASVSNAHLKEFARVVFEAFDSVGEWGMTLLPCERTQIVNIAKVSSCSYKPLPRTCHMFEHVLHSCLCDTFRRLCCAETMSTASTST